MFHNCPLLNTERICGRRWKKLSLPLKSIALQNVSVQLCSFTAQLIQFEVKQRRLSTVNVYYRCYFFVYLIQINLPHVFKMSTFGTYAYFETCIPLVNGCVNCALFNALPNVYFQNWKAWVIRCVFHHPPRFGWLTRLC